MLLWHRLAVSVGTGAEREVLLPTPRGEKLLDPLASAQRETKEAERRGSHAPHIPEPQGGTTSRNPLDVEAGGGSHAPGARGLNKLGTQPASPLTGSAQALAVALEPVHRCEHLPPPEEERSAQRRRPTEGAAQAQAGRGHRGAAAAPSLPLRDQSLLVQCPLRLLWPPILRSRQHPLRPPFTGPPSFSRAGSASHQRAGTARLGKALHLGSPDRAQTPADELKQSNQQHRKIPGARAT